MAIVVAVLAPAIYAQPIASASVNVYNGEVTCNRIGLGCAGATHGFMTGWWVFDEGTGDFIAYREDSLLGFGYVREIVNATGQYDWYYNDPSDTCMSCIYHDIDFSFNYSFEGAVSLNKTEVVGSLAISVDLWSYEYYYNGAYVEATLYSDPDTGAWRGWQLGSGGVQYVYYAWKSAEAPPSSFLMKECSATVS